VAYFELIKPGTRIDFIGRWRLWMAISGLVILLGAAGAAVRGVKFGIDFAGGTEVQLRFPGDAPVSEELLRGAATEAGITGASVVRLGGSGREFAVKFEGERRIEGAASTGEVTEKNDRVLALVAALERRAGRLEILNTEFVGPKVGAELREDGIRALLISFAAILLYIAVRFNARFAPGAVVALVHDVLVTCSFWVLLGLPFDLQVLAALLTIIGYSLNDTIVVFDRIRENIEVHSKRDLADVVNRSVNEMLGRTLLTSIATLLAVLALLFLAGPVVRPFALAMTFGIFAGAYSTIYIASPIMIWLEQRYGERAKAPSGKTKQARA
jgi:preprotein translocase subunit SecF